MQRRPIEALLHPPPLPIGIGPQTARYGTRTIMPAFRTAVSWTGQSSTPGRWLPVRPIKPGDDSDGRRRQPPGLAQRCSHHSAGAKQTPQAGPENFFFQEVGQLRALRPGGDRLPIRVVLVGELAAAGMIDVAARFRRERMKEDSWPPADRPWPARSWTPYRSSCGSAPRSRSPGHPEAPAGGACCSRRHGTSRSAHGSAAW